jgi:hypothetical protein
MVEYGVLTVIIKRNVNGFDKSKNIYKYIFLLFYYYFHLKKLLFGITIILSKYFTKGEVIYFWKSLWCIMVNIIPFLSIGIGHYFHRK